MSVPSVRKRIVDHAVEQLSGEGKPEDLHVHRSRLRPVEQDELPAQVVFVHQESAARVGGKFGPLNLRTLLLGVHCRVEGDPIDDALDPLLNWAEQQLMKDPRFGGLVNNVQLASIEWSGAAKDKDYGAALAIFAIEYQALAGDPTKIV